MLFLKRLFGKSNQPVEEEPGLERHIIFFNTLRLPTIAFTAGLEGGHSKIGGLPLLPENVAWPEWKQKPLAFLCQVDLSELPEACDRNGLPPSGMLYFFYSAEQETWGFDPKDEGSWRVIYASSPSGSLRTAPLGLEKDCIYMEKPVSFTAVETYPDWQDDRIGALNLDDSQADEYIDLCGSVFGGHPAHHLFGYPSPVQGNDMDLECQLVSRGLYCGDTSGYHNAQAKELEAGRHDWILLLQLDSDDDAGMMWGDCGMLYFWIKKQDLANGHFDKCWMILQCS